MKADVTIIGGGPAGVEAALSAAEWSKNVILVSNHPIGELKSAYTNMILNHEKDILKYQTFWNPLFEQRKKEWEISLSAKLIEKGIHIVKGTAEFIDQETIRVFSDDEHLIQSNKVIVATGSHPVFPNKMQPDGNRIFSYQNIYKLTFIPSTMLVVGDGPIGYEMVNFFSNLGIKVTWLFPQQPFELYHENIQNYLLDFYIDKGVNIIKGPYVTSVVSKGGACCSKKRRW
ncbi:FAD-dependent oxidoreductase [Bacillus carboniphilus]|uniref:FAD-dependent oxidoreductase n=1 Tax=Bacillus carboniphilus TaxID=86663 RepID=A0ABY9JXY1_9BACI|nr:FAD-dependent oxidoreductase [Bacillus carboniphilus]WLR43382.1 FAD-dependent oxidoreductase [Bacillus carboniphilus]